MRIVYKYRKSPKRSHAFTFCAAANLLHSGAVCLIIRTAPLYKRFAAAQNVNARNLLGDFRSLQTIHTRWMSHTPQFNNELHLCSIARMQITSKWIVFRTRIGCYMEKEDHLRHKYWGINAVKFFWTRKINFEIPNAITDNSIHKHVFLVISQIICIWVIEPNVMQPNVIK